MIGKTLGHYQITDKLGEGGMGVVYKARDTHLDRFVAIKVLAAEKVADRDRKRRFVQEAKAASALNHPNIIHIYDIDQAEGTDFIAMEYVEGKTLAQLIPRRGMQLGEALKYAVQITDALARAHGAGIVHRDLKPSNIMVDEHSLVKVLDFGLAKLAEAAPSGGDESTRTVDATTEKGTIVGTTAYMSPEQAAGRKMDARSDIFSFGSVLYEMVTGRRAFEADSKFSTLAAVIERDPASLAGEVPYELERIIGRCLKKDPERRFQHMHDLKVELQEFKEDSDSGRVQPAPSSSRQVKSTKLVMGGFAVAAVIAAVFAGWYLLNQQHPAGPALSLTAIPLTSYPGVETTPTFSPDGDSVAFQWCPEGPQANCDIYIKQIGLEPPIPLTTDPAEDYSPAWSPDGRFIAFLRKLPTHDAALVIKPQRGGQERVLVESGVPRFDDLPGSMSPYVTWTPDSKCVVFPWSDPGKVAGGLFLLSVGASEKRRLTEGNDASPAFSPDGRALVFTRWHGGRSEIRLLRLGAAYEPEGAPQSYIATGEPFDWAAAWMPDGSEIVFSSGSHNSGGLWRVAASASANPRRLALPAEDVGPLALSRHGNRLAYVLPQYRTSIWRVDLRSPSQTPGSPFPLIRSSRSEWAPVYSPDGRRITFASDRSGHYEIWACDSDGSNAVPLTSLGRFARGSRWSADGRSIVFEAAVEDNADIYVMSANGGALRRLTSEPADDSWPCWSHDGRSIYFKSNRSGRGEIWKQPAAGGAAVEITRNGADLPQESPEGKRVYFLRGHPYPEKCSVWSVPADGGEETEVIDSLQCDGGWHVAELGIYFFAVPEQIGRSELQLHEFATGKTRRILILDQQVTLTGLAVSPDGRTILYGQWDQAGSDLMLVENFR
jgi:serine/threonine protein kinase